MFLEESESSPKPFMQEKNMATDWKSEERLDLGGAQKGGREHVQATEVAGMAK